MLTILSAIELSTEYLQKKGVDSARLNAELLLAEILNCKRMELYLKFDQPLLEEEKVSYREFIKRRGDREPLQYITSKAEFYGLEFELNSNVLIPRPETEFLIEEILKSVNQKRHYRILDIGTGSGNIPIVLAKNIEDSFILSIDKSEKAIKVASQNSITHKVNNKIEFECVDIKSFSIDPKNKFDIVVSNPPYISKIEFDKLEPELINYEPKSALTDNGDGLYFYNLISEKSKDLLNEKGKIFFEIGINQSDKVSEILKGNNFTNIEIINDYQNIPRVISGELS